MIDTTTTFDQWNRQETERIAALSGVDVAKLVRKARKGGLFCFMVYDEYVDYCTDNNLTPEPMFDNTTKERK